jgi:hypothetical protein
MLCVVEQARLNFLKAAFTASPLLLLKFRAFLSNCSRQREEAVTVASLRLVTSVAAILFKLL